VSILTPHERPGTRPRRSWVFDFGIALLALAIASTWSFAGAAVSPLPVWSAALIVIALTAPLVVRRVWPVPVFAWCLLVAACTGWWAMQIVWSPALVVALYTVAALRPRREALTACGLIICGSVVAAVHVLPHNWYGAAVALTAVAVAATGIGLYVGTRRVLLLQLRQRAVQLERERDQQGAIAAAAERARIAREMHDIVAHHLTVMVALADGAAAQTVRDPDRAAEAMRTVSATGRLALGDTRRLLGVLRSDAEVDGDGAAARSPLPDLAQLDELIDGVRAAGLPVSYTTDGHQREIAPAVQLTVFRLVQEALTNTMKHGGSTARASVRISYGVEEVRIEVDDDGRGPAAGADSGTGRGLAGMRERVGALGGEVVSGPRTPHGWSVTARLRLDSVDSR
jgi:signal transduction histidine kinase